MRKYISAILAVLMMLSCASAESAAVTLGDVTLLADPAWGLDIPDAYQLYIYDASGSIMCNLQYYDYDSLSQSHDELIASGLENDYGIAEMILSSIDVSGDMFSDMEKEYAEYGGGISAVRYYGRLTPAMGNGYYSGTLMVNSDFVLSALTISYTRGTDMIDVRSFDNAVVSRIYLDGSPITEQQSGNTDIPDISSAGINDYFDGYGAAFAETAELSCISFVTPQGWELISCDSTQAIYTCGDASICLNAYAPGTLYPGMDKLEAEKLIECLIYIVDAAMEATGIDTQGFEFIPASLANGDTAIFFEGDAGAAMQDQYLTSAMFMTHSGVTGLITILTPEDDQEVNNALLAQSVNMYYSSDVIHAADIPHHTLFSTNEISALANAASLAANGSPDSGSSTPADETGFTGVITGIDGPVAAVISTSGPSLNEDESAALTAAIAYTASGEYTYETLVETLVSDGFSYEAAVFAADNCGADWAE